MVLCEVPRADGSSARFVLPERLVALLRRFDGRGDSAEVARECAAAGAYSPEAFERLVSGFLLPRAILLDEAAAPVDPPRPPTRLSSLSMRTRLLPPAVVTPIARSVGWLFARPVFALGVAVVVAAHFLFYLVIGPGQELGWQQVRGSHVGLIMLLMGGSVVLHEFGHAAAAAHFGCRRLEIGWGMYYHMSVLYTDLSEAWRLPRKQRALIDVGGMYFQALFGVAMLGAYAATGSLVPLYCFVATDLAIASSLNPFFRMDGYWLVSDLLGVPNLHAQSAALLRRLALRCFGRRAPAGDAPAIGRGGLAFMAAYSAFGLAFFVFAFNFAVQRLLVGVVVTFPAALSSLGAAVVASPFSAGGVGSALFAVTWRSLVIFGTAKFLYNFLSALVGGVVSVARALRAARSGRAPRLAAG
jgi:putative peptide zinc metalloprotease protein